MNSIRTPRKDGITEDCAAKENKGINKKNNPDRIYFTKPNSLFLRYRHAELLFFIGMYSLITKL
jgi:hypothetical protein